MRLAWFWGVLEPRGQKSMSQHHVSCRGVSGEHSAWWGSEEVGLNKLLQLETYTILATNKAQRREIGRRPHFLKPRDLP